MADGSEESQTSGQRSVKKREMNRHDENPGSSSVRSAKAYPEVRQREAEAMERQREEEAEGRRTASVALRGEEVGGAHNSGISVRQLDTNAFAIVASQVVLRCPGMF